MDTSQVSQAQAVQAIVDNVIHTVAIIAPIVAMATIGTTEFVKKLGLAAKWAGIASYVEGFLISIVVMGVLTGSFWSPLAILIGFISGFGASGIYSGVKALATNGNPTPTPAQ